MQAGVHEGVLVEAARQGAGVAKVRWWSGWILTGLVAAFLLFDAAGKFAMPKAVVDACVRLGFPTTLGFALGVILTVCTVIYLIPRTSILGAVLLTGYLGGAVAIQMRAGSPVFETVFPIIFAAMAWAGIYLRDGRLRALVLGRSA